MEENVAEDFRRNTRAEVTAYSGAVLNLPKNLQISFFWRDYSFTFKYFLLKIRGQILLVMIDIANSFKK